MVTDDAPVFFDQLRARLGQESLVRKIESSRPELPPVYSVIYRNFPEAGMLTAVTYGLSVVDHPAWKLGKPELIVTLRTLDEMWAYAAAFFVDQLRGEKPFSFGSVFALDEPLATGSTMTGCFILSPAILSPEQARFTLPGKTINLVGLYPVYAGEVELIQQIGLEQFWYLEGYDRFSVIRPDLSKSV